MFDSVNNSSPFGGSSVFDKNESSGSSIFDSPSGKEPQGSMFDKPAGNEPQRSMFDKPAGNEPQGSMFDKPAGNEPQGSMFDKPAGNEPQGSMFDNLGGIDLARPETDNKSTKMNNQDLNIGDTDKYKASYLINESNIANLNVRGSNYGQMNMLDRMRGIESNRLDMDLDNVSLAEQYSDASLDKRAMGGMYNTTLSDIYNDKTKYAAHHGLTYDGYIDIQDEGYNVDGYAYASDKKEQGTLMGTSYNKEYEKHSENIDHLIIDSKNKYETHYENPMDKFKKDQRNSYSKGASEYEIPLNIHQNNSSHRSILDYSTGRNTGLDLGGSSLTVSSMDMSSPYDKRDEDNGLTPGEKYKEQRAQDNLTEKELKQDKKRQKKEEKSIYETQRREEVAQKNKETEELDKLRNETAANEDKDSFSGGMFGVSNDKDSEKEEKSILDSAHDDTLGLNEKEEKDLTPGEKLKLKKEESDLLEKEQREANKLKEKENKEQMKIERREQAALDHIDKISQSYKTEENSSMYMDSNKNISNNNDNMMLGGMAVGTGLSALDIGSGSTGSEKKKTKSIYELDEEEESDNPFSASGGIGNSNKPNKELYTSNPSMKEEGTGELTPGEKLKLKREESDLLEKEQREANKLKEKENKEQMKIERREQAALDHIDKISQSYKTEENSSMYFDDNSSAMSKSNNDDKIMLASGLSALDIGAGSTGSEAKKINKSMYKRDILEEEELDNPFSRALGNSNKPTKELYTSNPSMKEEGTGELTPGEKFKLKREELKLQGKIDKNILKTEKRVALAQENIDNNLSIYFDTDTNPMSSETSESSIKGNSEVYKLDEALNKKSFYVEGDEEELTPEQKLRIKKEAQNLLEAEERDEKKRLSKLEKEDLKRKKREQENKDFISGVSGAMASISTIGSTKSKQTGFIKEDDNKIILKEEIGSIRSNIILPNTEESIKTKNPLNYTEDDEDLEDELANNILDEHKRESKILNYNEDDEDSDEPEHFKQKAPIVGKKTLKEKKVATNIEEQGKINEIKRYEEEKKSKLPNEVIDNPNVRENSKKIEKEEDFNKKEEEIRLLMERLSIDTIERYLQNIYSKRKKTKIDKIKIKVGEMIISASL